MVSLDDKEDARSITRQSKRKAAASRNNTSVFPVVLTCSPSKSSSSSIQLECGLLLSFIILGLYLFGFYESFMSLPDPPKLPDWRHHVGENFNLAHDEWNSRRLGMQQQQQQQNGDESSKAVAVVADNAAAAANSNEQNNGGVFIPKGVWPVSIRNELDNFETIIHPGDGVSEMSVPKFWSKPIHNNQLMSRETAMRIGTCIEPDSKGNYNRGDDCPVHQRTIFVAIASYRDFECRSTAESIFNRAQYPNRVRLSVVDQIVDGEDPVCNQPIVPCTEDPTQALCVYKDSIDVYEMEAQLSIGPVFARHIGHRMYRGEYYVTQSDAHVTYTQNWDSDIISQMEATRDEMAVLSTYLTDVQGSIDKNGHSLRDTRPIMCNTVYEGGAQGMHLRHGSQPERRPAIHGMPQLQPWWAAGYSFSRGHFAVNVPYDPYQPMIFQGEEMSIGIRGFTIGYDYYAPERSVCFHHYAVGDNAKIRNKVPHFWENDRKYQGTGKSAMSRLLGIVHMNPEVDPSTWDHRDEDMYGIGQVRTPEKFYETFGIDVVRKKVQGHLCLFVHGNDGPMHRKFTPHLRPDGMGIDYSKIDYKFVDPQPNNK